MSVSKYQNKTCSSYRWSKDPVASKCFSWTHCTSWLGVCVPLWPYKQPHITQRQTHLWFKRASVCAAVCMCSRMESWKDLVRENVCCSFSVSSPCCSPRMWAVASYRRWWGTELSGKMKTVQNRKERKNGARYWPVKKISQTKRRVSYEQSKAVSDERFSTGVMKSEENATVTEASQVAEKCFIWVRVKVTSLTKKPTRIQDRDIHIKH